MDEVASRIEARARQLDTEFDEQLLQFAVLVGTAVYVIGAYIIRRRRNQPDK